MGWEQGARHILLLQLRSIWIPFLPAQLADCVDCNRANWGTGQSLLFCAIQELISLLQSEIWFHEGF